MDLTARSEVPAIDPQFRQLGNMMVLQPLESSVPIRCHIDVRVFQDKAVNQPVDRLQRRELFNKAVISHSPKTQQG